MKQKIIFNALAILVTAGIFTVVKSQDLFTEDSVKPDPHQCTRTCTTRYSGEECWAKSFDFFIKDFLFNLVRYYQNSGFFYQMDKEDPESLYESLNTFTNNTFYEFYEEIQYLDEADSSYGKNFTKAIGDSYDKIVQKFIGYKEILKDLEINQTCPINCAIDNNSIVNTYKILTIVLLTASGLIGITFTIFYIIYEHKVVLSNKKK